MSFSTEFVFGGGAESDTNAILLSQSSSGSIGDTVTVTKDGVYSISARIDFTGTPNANGAVVLIYANGVEVARGGNQTDGVTASVSYFGSLKAGGTISFGVVLASFGSPTVRIFAQNVAPVVDVVKVNSFSTGTNLQLDRDVWVPLFEYTPTTSGFGSLRIQVSTALAGNRIGVDVNDAGATILLTGSLTYDKQFLVPLTAGHKFSIKAYSTSFSTNQRIVNSWNIGLV